MIFDNVKAALTMTEVARAYGSESNRAGFVRCPFHADRTPSMKLYQDSYYCFGCGEHGDVVDFVGRLFQLTPLDALKKLNDDFNLGLQFDHAPPDPAEQEQRQREREARQLFDEWKVKMLNRLDACVRIANTASYDSVSDAEAVAIQYRESLIFWADVLMHGDLDEKMEVFRDEGVERICQTILGNSLTKSKAS